MPAFVFSERAAEGTAVDQQILPGNVAGMRGAQERAGRAKLVRIAEALGRNGRDAIGGNLGDALALLLGGFTQNTAQPVGIESARQYIVDGDILVRDRARDA